MSFRSTAHEKKHDDTHHYRTKKMSKLSILITWNIAFFPMDTRAVVLVVHLECLIHSYFKFVFFTWWFVFDLVSLTMFLKYCIIMTNENNLSSLTSHYLIQGALHYDRMSRMQIVHCSRTRIRM